MNQTLLGAYTPNFPLKVYKTEMKIYSAIEMGDSHVPEILIHTWSLILDFPFKKEITERNSPFYLF